MFICKEVYTNIFICKEVNNVCSTQVCVNSVNNNVFKQHQLVCIGSSQVFLAHRLKAAAYMFILMIDNHNYFNTFNICYFSMREIREIYVNVSI